MQPEPKTVSNAIDVFLNADSWDEKRTVLEREQALLLTDIADSLLVEKIEEVKKDTYRGKQQQAQELELSLTLLRQAREVGISTAWEGGLKTLAGTEPPPASPLFGTLSAQKEPPTSASSSGNITSPTSAWNTTEILPQARELARELLRHSDVLDDRLEAALRTLLEPELTSEQTTHGFLALAGGTAQVDAQTNNLLEGLPAILQEWYKLPSWPSSRIWLRAHLAELPAEAMTLFTHASVIAQKAAAGGIVERLNVHVQLLEKTVLVGADEAYRSVIGDAAFGEGVGQVSNPSGLLSQILAWIGMPDWNASRGYLYDHPALLIDASEVLFVGLEGLFQNDVAQREMIKEHGMLLRDARERDIDTAYKRFIEGRQQQRRRSSELDGLLEEMRALMNLTNNAERQVEVCQRILELDDTIHTLSAHSRAAVYVTLGNALYDMVEQYSAVKGISLLKQAINCYEAALVFFTRETSPSEWAAVQHNKGNAARKLAQLLEGEPRLEMVREAIASYEAALVVYRRDVAPLQWAGLLNDKGTLLISLAGMVDIKTEQNELLETAITCFDDAQLEFRREVLPLEWAGTQNNKGIALHSQAKLLAGQEKQAMLQKAIDCFNAALLERHLELVPMEHAGTQKNKAAALYDLSQVLEGGARTLALREAIACIDIVLGQYKRELAPLEWAGTQINRGASLQKLAEVLEGLEREASLREAISCYEAALLEYNREEVPLDWAAAQHNRGAGLQQLAELLAGKAREGALRDAVSCYDKALLVYRSGSIQLQGIATLDQKRIALRALAKQLDGEAQLTALREAILCSNMALADLPREANPLAWATRQFDKAILLVELAELQQGVERINALREAIACYDNALLEYRPEVAPFQHALARGRKIAALQELVGLLEGSSDEGIAAAQTALDRTLAEASISNDNNEATTAAPEPQTVVWALLNAYDQPQLLLALLKYQEHLLDHEVRKTLHDMALTARGQGASEEVIAHAERLVQLLDQIRTVQDSSDEEPDKTDQLSVILRAFQLWSSTRFWRTQRRQDEQGENRDDEELDNALDALSAADSQSEIAQVFNAHTSSLTSVAATQKALARLETAYATADNDRVYQSSALVNKLAILQGLNTDSVTPHQVFETYLTFHATQREAASLLDALVSAGSWNERRQLLNEYRNILLSDPALTLLQINISRYQAEGNKRLALTLELYLELLGESRAMGVSAAFERFFARLNKKMEAGDAFLNARTPDKTREILEEWHAELLTPMSLYVLGGIAENERSQSNFAEAERIEYLIKLLEEVRDNDIPSAWQRFEEEYVTFLSVQGSSGTPGEGRSLSGPGTSFAEFEERDVKKLEHLSHLLDQWYSMPKWSDSRLWLADHLAELPADALIMLNRGALNARAAGDGELAAQILLHVALLTQARIVGVDTAYQAIIGDEAFEENKQADLRDQIVEWMRIGDSSASRAYLQSHPALLSDEAVAFLERLRGIQRSDEALALIERHRQLLRDARLHGIETAYHRRLVASPEPDKKKAEEAKRLQQLFEWIARRDDWKASQKYLRTHPDLLDLATETTLEEWLGLQPNLTTRAIFLDHHRLLQDAREYGTDAAYERFSMAKDISEDPTDHQELGGLVDELWGNLNDIPSDVTQQIEILRQLLQREDFPQSLGENFSGSIHDALAAALIKMAQQLGAADARAALEEAIAHCEHAINVYTQENYVMGLAESFSNKGAALRELSDLLEGEAQISALEQSIASFDDALTALPNDLRRLDYALAWASTQNNKGNVLNRLAHLKTGQAQKKDLSEAIACYDYALSERRRRAEPLGWALTQNNKGNALSTLARLTGGDSRVSLLRQAIDCFNAALPIQNRDNAPLEWAMTQLSKGGTWQQLAGMLEREATVSAYEEALSCFEAALLEYRRDKAPLSWAATQSGKGITLSLLSNLQPIDTRRVTLREAVSCLDNALLEYNRELSPLDWAETQNFKGHALAKLAITLAAEEQVENLREAIACCDQALLVYRREIYPNQWAMTNYTKGYIFFDLYTVVGDADRPEVLDRTFACFDNTLSIETREDSPLEHLALAWPIALLRLFMGQWAEAVRYLTSALDAYEDLFKLQITTQGRESLLTSAGHIHVYLAYALLRAGRGDAPLRAAEVLERGRARTIGEIVTRQEAQLLEAERLSPSLLLGFRVASERLATMLQQKGGLDTFVSASQMVPILESTMEQHLLPDNLRNEVEIHRALDRQLAGYAEARAVWAEYHHMVDRIKQVMPDFLKDDEAVKSAAMELDPEERLGYVASTEFGSCAVLLCRTADGTNTINAAGWWDEGLTEDVLKHLLYRKDPHTGEMSGFLPSQGGTGDLGIELQQVVHALSRADGALVRMLNQCREEEARGLVLIPCGLLGLLPLHAVPILSSSDGSSLEPAHDIFRVSYAPSARIWKFCRYKAKSAAEELQALIIGNPLPQTELKQLPGAEIEAKKIATLIEDQMHGQVTLFENEHATRPAILTELRQYKEILTHAHFACHGLADLNNPQESGMLLAHDARLMVRDLLDPTMRFERLRLVGLSACRTGLSGTRLPDEAIGLPSAWLQAGGAAVLASLWPVSDTVTAALMMKFYELHLIDRLIPVEALWLAQRWLRQIPSWKEDCKKAGATYSAMGQEASDIIRIIAQLNDDRSLPEAIPSKYEQGRDNTEKLQETWNDLRHWAAFVTFGA
jgi:CHAT domain-containing protein/tetratricopeptide (TPR) repeat protein